MTWRSGSTSAARSPRRTARVVRAGVRGAARTERCRKSRAHARYHRALQRGALLAAPLCGHLTVAHGVLESTRTAGVLERFDPAAFVQGTGALYLLSKDGGGSASPLMAALTDRVLREATLGRATGRSARPPARRFPRRGGRRLPDRRPPPALQPPRVARHRAAHPAAFLPAGPLGLGGGRGQPRPSGPLPPSSSSAPASTTLASPTTSARSSVTTTSPPRTRRRAAPSTTAAPPRRCAGTGSSVPRRSAPCREYGPAPRHRRQARLAAALALVRRTPRAGRRGGLERRRGRDRQQRSERGSGMTGERRTSRPSSPSSGPGPSASKATSTPPTGGVMT